MTIDYNTRKVLQGKLWQYNYGQVLRIQGGDLQKAQEMHFALEETGGDSVTRIGITQDGVTDVVIPDTMLENNDSEVDYPVYLFIYNRDDTSGETVEKFVLNVLSRPKPEHTGGSDDGDTFGKVVEEVNNAADRAETAERQAGEHAEQTKADVEKTSTDRKEVERLVETVSDIDEQIETVKEYKEQAQTAATNALSSERKSNEAKEAALQSRAGAEAAADETELLAGQVEADKNTVEQAKAVVLETGQEIAEAKNNVSKTVKQFAEDAEKAVKNVTGEGAKQVKSIQDAQKKAEEAVETSKTNAVQIVQEEGTTQVRNATAEGTKQVQAVEKKGKEVIESIPEDFTMQMQSKLDKQQGAEHAGKLLGVDDDGNVAPSELKGRRLLVKYIHKANGSVKLSDLDLQTGTFTTSEPHGLKENTALYIKPLAGCVPKHIPIEIFRNNKGQWGRGNIYAHVIDEFNFQILSKKDGDVLLFTDAANKEVNLNNFTFEYNMKNIALTNINSKHIEVIVNGICSGGYYAIVVVDNYKRLHSTRYASGRYNLLSVGQVPAHFTYSCHMSFDRGNVISSIPLNTKAVDGMNYAVNQSGSYPTLVVYSFTNLALGTEYIPREEREDGYIVEIRPFSNEVFPFNDSYVEIWGYDE